MDSNFKVDADVFEDIKHHLDMVHEICAAHGVPIKVFIVDSEIDAAFSVSEWGVNNIQGNSSDFIGMIDFMARNRAPLMRMFRKATEFSEEIMVASQEIHQNQVEMENEDDSSDTQH